MDAVRGPRRLAVYAFGKHPAFADFIDVGRLPPVPGPFRHFHDVLRPAVERDGGPAEPVLIAWHDGVDSAVLHVHPSRDRGDAATGWYRRCPLLLGVAARCPLPVLLRFAGGRLPALADDAMSAGADGLFARIAHAAAEWPGAFPAADDPTGPAAAAVAVADNKTFLVAGPGGVVAEVAAVAAVSTVTLAGWVARVAEPAGPIG